jgi:hypothetical protein
MKKIIVSILCLIFLVGIVSCSDDVEPNIRIRNDRINKANIQLQTTGGNTININDITTNQTTAYQSIASGNVNVTAVIQNESVSPKVSFYAAKDESYTVVIVNGNVPTLRVEN